MGSELDDYGDAISMDDSGNVYVAGTSDIICGSPVNAHRGGIDVFAAKLDANGYRIWHAFMGFAASHFGGIIEVDASGSVYVAGDSESAWGSPINSYGGYSDVCAAKLDAEGVLIWNIFIGGKAMNMEVV